MAVSSIIQVATWMNAAIKATTPDVRDGIPYRKASGSAPLQEQEPNGRDSQRQFQIQMAPIIDLGDFVGPCYELHHEMMVVMRYVMDGRNRDDWDDLQLMAADDAKRIVLALTRPPLSAPWSDGGIFNIVPVDHEPITRNERWEGVWEQTVTFDCLYANEATTRDFECMTVYPDFATLSATDGTTAWLGSTRAEVRRLTDGTLYQWSGTEWSSFFDAGDVPAFADLAAIEAATLAGEKVAYSTADSRLARVESDVARLLFDEGDVNTYANTTAMESATLYGEELGVVSGNVYQMQGGSAVELAPVGALIGNGYTDVSLLLASTGAYSGEQAVWWESAGGTPLARFHWSTLANSGAGAWLLSYGRWRGLTSAEQAKWDALVRAGGDGYVWSSAGIEFDGTADEGISFDGLFSGITMQEAADYTALSFGVRCGIVTSSFPTSGNNYGTVMLEWGTSGNGIGCGVGMSSGGAVGGATARMVGGVRTYHPSFAISNNAANTWLGFGSWGLTGAGAESFRAGIRRLDGVQGSGSWSDLGNHSFSDAAADLTGLRLQWDPATGGDFMAFGEVTVAWGMP